MQQLYEGDLADGIHQLYSLEMRLSGNTGTFCHWAETIYELNIDYDESYSAAVKRLCDAFYDVVRNYGQSTAQQLYNTRSVILATEIRRAAKYLCAGGHMEDLPALAADGFFMSSWNDSEVEQAVLHMNNGGNTENIYSVIASKSPEITPADRPSVKGKLSIQPIHGNKRSKAPKEREDR